MPWHKGELTQQDIRKVAEQLVLGFKSIELRQITDFAIAQLSQVVALG